MKTKTLLPACSTQMPLNVPEIFPVGVNVSDLLQQPKFAGHFPRVHAWKQLYRSWRVSYFSGRTDWGRSGRYIVISSAYLRYSRYSLLLRQHRHGHTQDRNVFSVRTDDWKISWTGRESKVVLYSLSVRHRDVDIYGTLNENLVD